MDQSEDDVFKDSFDRRMRWSLDVGPEECSEVFAKVLLLDKKMKEALTKKGDTEIIAAVQRDLHVIRRLQPASGFGSLEEEQDAATVDNVLQDFIPLNIVHELRGPKAMQGVSFLKQMLNEAERHIKITMNGQYPQLVNSVGVCQSDHCFEQPGDLTAWAFIVVQKLLKTYHFRFHVTDQDEPSLHRFLETLAAGKPPYRFVLHGKEQKLTITSDEKEHFIMYDAAGAAEDEAKAKEVAKITAPGLTPFLRFANADWILRNPGNPIPMPDDAQRSYRNIWNTVCAPEFIQMLLRSSDRIGRPFPRNNNTSKWKAALESPLEGKHSFNFVCGECVGIADEWAVNILMTPHSIFFPRVVPDIGASGFVRFVALCRFDGDTPSFGLLVFDWTTKQLTYIKDPVSKIKPKHLAALQDWFRSAYVPLVKQDKTPLLEIQMVYFSSRDDSWAGLCKSLGSSGADLSACIASATTDEDRCAANASREQEEMSASEYFSAGLSKANKVYGKSLWEGAVDLFIGSAAGYGLATFVAANLL